MSAHPTLHPHYCPFPHVGHYINLDPLAMTDSSPPPSTTISSHPTRSRTTSDLLVRSPRLLHHRTQTGRIQQARSATSSRLLSLRNQEAIWEAATGRNWAPINPPHSSPEQSLPEFVTPLQLSEVADYVAAPSLSNLDLRSSETFPALRAREEEANRAGRAITPGGTNIPEPRRGCVA